ncbi:hypothetical protein AAFF_G00235670 [Aldrovandia affinis]|uniref:Uncharacterized protein n=1 Tax=Aldrovandia affinis TaxID=143900 RepID=A0AAD7SV43_9TELE|nr:hypothetical protein AAFF_G00235670 [Aldrovandia affinis]
MTCDQNKALLWSPAVTLVHRLLSDLHSRLLKMPIGHLTAPVKPAVTPEPAPREEEPEDRQGGGRSARCGRQPSMGAQWKAEDVSPLEPLADDGKQISFGTMPTDVRLANGN